MTEVVDLSPDGAYIQVRSSGRPSLTELEHTLNRIVELRRQYGINSVLVDSRERTEHPSLHELYAGGEMLAKTLGDEVRVAIVVSSSSYDHELFESIAVVYGGTVAYFLDMERAIRWLGRSVIANR